MAPTITIVQPSCPTVDFFMTGTTFIRISRPCPATIIFTRPI